MEVKLPSKLQREPLVEVLFELRFSSNSSFSDIVPGFLHTKLEGAKQIKRLPHSDLPKAIRDNDPNLQYSPLMAVLWGNYTIGIGDRILSISCNMPYPGWKDFRKVINQVLTLIDEMDTIQTISRYSLKYVDLIEGDSIKDQLSKTTLAISLDGEEILDGHTTLRVELPEHGFINIISVITSARAKFHDGSTREGVIVDVDTVENLGERPFKKWLNNLLQELEEIHDINKGVFFRCLKQETITSLEPEYE